MIIHHIYALLPIIIFPFTPYEVLFVWTVAVITLVAITVRVKQYIVHL